MILRAPAFIYPATVWGLRPPGSFIGSQALEPDADLYLPEFFNYSVESSNRRVRWFEIMGAGVITRNGVPPAPSFGCYQWDWGQGEYYNRPIDLQVYSYAGLRKPSYISFFVRLHCNGDSTIWRLAQGNADFDTDALIYPFGSRARSFRKSEVMAFTYRYDASLSAVTPVFTAAVGTWAQIQMERFGTVGALSRFRISLVTERQCRAYVDTINNLGGSPVFSFSGSGQTFAVAARGPSDTDLAISAGGTTFNGGSPEFYFLAGRSSNTGFTAVQLRFDFEVPYDI